MSTRKSSWTVAVASSCHGEITRQLPELLGAHRKWARKKRWATSPNAGFALLEVMIALGLLAITLPAAYSFVITSMSAVADGSQEKVAVGLMDSQLEQARQEAPGSLSTYQPCQPTRPCTTTLNYVSFKVVTSSVPATLPPPSGAPSEWFQVQVSWRAPNSSQSIVDEEELCTSTC